MSIHPLSLAHLAHLSRRAWGSLRARPLGPREQVEVASLVEGRPASLFWEQPVMDQRHALEAARRVLRRSGSAQLARAALLHDVGKRHAGLGVLGRVAATMLALTRLPARGRFSTYLDHARIGADDLAAAGAEPLTVEYAMHQDRARPSSIDAEAWRCLKEADDESHRL